MDPLPVKGSPSRVPSSVLDRWAWAAIAGVLLLMVLWAGSRESRESPLLLATCNTLFLGGTSLLVAWLAGRTWLRTGLYAVLALGFATGTFGLAGVLAGPLVEVDDAATLAVHGLGSLLSALGQLTSAVLTILPAAAHARSRRRRTLATAYGVPALALAAVAGLALTGYFPAFLTPGGHSSSLRLAVLGSSISLFAASAVVFRVVAARTRSAFPARYAAGLVLIALGLGGVALAEPGTPLCWIGRASQYLGAITLLVSTVHAAREGRDWGIPLAEAVLGVQGPYHAVVNLSPNAIVVHRNGWVLFANPATPRLFGARSLADIQARPLLDRVHVQDRPRMASALRDGKPGAAPEVHECRLSLPDGTERPVEFLSATIDYDGQPAILSTIRDVTERQRSAAALQQSREEQDRVLQELRRSQERLAVAYQAAQAATWEWNLDTGTLEWAPEVFTLYGLPPEARPGLETWLACIHPADRQRVQDATLEAVRQQTGVEYEFRIRRPDDGRVRWILSLGTLAPRPGGTPGRMLGIFLDATDRKNAERGIVVRNRISEVFLTTQDDRMYARVLAVLLDALDSEVGIFGYIDEGGALVVPSFTPSAWDRCEVPGKTTRFPPEGWGGMWGTALAEGSTFLSNRPGRPPAGHIPVENVMAVPVLHQGTPIGVFQVANRPGGYDDEDVAFLESLAAHAAPVLAARLLREREERERRRAEEALRASEEELRQLNNELEVRVAQRTAEAEGQAARLLELASELSRAEQRERQRLARVLHDHIQQMLVAAKLHAGVLQARVQEPTLRAVAGQVMELLAQSIEESRSLTVELSPPVLEEAGLAAGLDWLARRVRDKQGLEVDIAFDPAAEPASSDERVLLFDAVRELLFNVVKHARTDRAKVRAGRDEEGRVQVTVEDEGAGFDPASARGSGSGYGLFSLQQRLRYQGGRLDISSSPGGGTRVEVRGPLPRPATAPENGREGAPAKANGARTPAVGHIRVLLADDHLILRQGIASLLQDETDIEVVGEAADGEAAVTLVRSLRPDVVVMDVSMPRMNGVDATRRITSELPGTRVVGLSMFADQSITDAMIEAGASATLTKGGPSDDLVRAIRDAARMRPIAAAPAAS